MRQILLIDAENFPANRMEGLMRKVSKYGAVKESRIYASNWAQGSVQPWKKLFKEYKLVQSRPWVSGRNAADIAIILAALDVAAAHRADALCLVSNDCIFVPLVKVLRKAGLHVYGFGRTRSGSLPSACDKYEEIPAPSRAKVKKPAAKKRRGTSKKKS